MIDRTVRARLVRLRGDVKTHRLTRLQDMLMCRRLLEIDALMLYTSATSLDAKPFSDGMNCSSENGSGSFYFLEARSETQPT
jgi:hypothetical protein